MPASLAAYHYFSPQTAVCNPLRRELTESAAGRRCAGSQRLAPPRCRRRQQQQRAAALFGFGNKPAAAEPAAPPQDGPIIIPYTPVSKTKDYSLRLFNAYPVAEVEYFRRDEGFFVLGSYMSGNNAAEARCRETQPVVMCYSPDGSKKMRIHIVLRDGGADGGGAALPPAPNNGDIEIAVAGGELVAVRQFEGNATQEACERCRQQLLAALQRDGLQLAEAEAGGYFRLAQYGPLHSLSTRMNEIWLAVKLG